jgi:hypothetical protein
MASVTCYGGVGEIGGNRVRLSVGDAKVWLDFGFSFGAEGSLLRLDRSGTVPGVPAIGEEDPEEPTASELFDPGTNGRVIVLWEMPPGVSAPGSFLVFQFLRS